MIALETRDAVLARFVRELDAQSPLSIDEVSPPDVARFDARDVEAARFSWSARIVDEYRSVVVFSELLRCLAEAAAPFPALCAVQSVIGDELRHVALCARVAGWLGAEGRLEVDVAGLGLPPSDATPIARAHEIVVRELIAAEGESLLVLAAYRDVAREPAIRRAFEILVQDEARHYAAGRSLRAALESAFPELGGLDEVLAEDVAHMRAIYRRAAALGGAGRALGASITTADLPSSWAA
jgi:hypothetical protein